MTKTKNSGLTYAELLVAITVIAVFATLAIPAGNSGISVRATQLKALSAAKQIGIACKLFAGDHEGYYPTNLLDAQGHPTAIAPANSNQALGQLFPDYVPDLKAFWLPQDKYYCNSQPPTGPKPSGPSGAPGAKPACPLGPGDNHWAYVTNLRADSQANLPLIADPTLPGTTRYSTDVASGGGTWKGKKAIVIYADTSGNIETVNSTSRVVSGPNAEVKELFQPGPNWLEEKNRFLNPIPRVK